MLERLRTADAPLTFSELRVALGEPPAARVRTRLRDARRERRGRAPRQWAAREIPYLYAVPER